MRITESITYFDTKDKGLLLHQYLIQINMIEFIYFII